MKTRTLVSIVAAGACALSVGCSKKSEEQAPADPGAKAVEVAEPAPELAAPTPEPVAAIPEGSFAITPSIVVADVDAAMEYYVKVLGAERDMVLPGPDGKTMHGEIIIGDSRVMIDVANPAYNTKGPADVGGTNGSLNVWTEDPDGLFKKAVDAGAKVEMPVALQFWGDRFGQFTDPFGHSWAVMKHEIDVPDEMMAELGAKAMASGGTLKDKPPGEPATAYKQEGYHDVTPAIHLAGGMEALAFYEKALGATVENKMLMPDGKSLMHAELVIGDSRVMVSSENEQFGSKSAKTLGGAPLGLYLYTEKVDGAFEQAVAAGAEAVDKPASMFWGDRYGSVRDPSGILWGVATHEKDLTEEEIAAGMKEMMAGMAAGAAEAAPKSDTAEKAAE